MQLQAGAKSDLAFRGGVNDGTTALNCASCNGHVEVVRLLLDTGTGKDMTDSFGDTALIKASYKGHVPFVRLLQEAGANTDFAGEHGSTALSFASCRGHVEVVRLLLEAGANKDLADDCKNTALIFASDEGHVEVVRLLEAGADQYAAIKTAWMLAFENANSAVSCWIPAPPWMCQTTACCFREILQSCASFRKTALTTQV